MLYSQGTLVTPQAKRLYTDRALAEYLGACAVWPLGTLRNLIASTRSFPRAKMGGNHARET